ncbi:unnamed protein product [Rotaria socialis]|uniref:Methyltransferase-like protein 22 n=1 Tax=Rotaria socialis TaxID=392032 RepID=A0A820SLF7_9BILA|nr:unnamed protein product [Rotaria socialis]CAF3322227.1 unnamed protein product [Rotaria socialis]CAF3488251.1 unnamed protein product [Rotaria socialis]CAF3616415.1 unnamed protein product [Rotaria socialis]CAF4275191.1 unnamed protein product [Rotaria socialis]
MSEEQNDQYLIYSDVFSAIQDKTKSGEFFKNSIQFFIISNEKRADINLVDDDDGDPDLCRPERIDLTLVHRNETNVSECGYQLWNGALLLCDYILTNSCRFSNKTIFELGAGIGLCSLIASRLASKVICTDHDNDLLDVVRQNIELNDAVCRKECIEIQEFDWKQFNLNEIDDRIEIVFAADVIYDDDITDALFNVLRKCFQEKFKLHSIYITVEKRINFYLDTLSVRCPAYEYFLEKLHDFQQDFPVLTFEKMNTDFNSIKQCTKIYERTNELVQKRRFCYFI